MKLLEEKIRVRTGVTCLRSSSDQGGSVTLNLGPAKVDLGPRSSCVGDILEELSTSSNRVDDLVDRVIEADGETAALGIQMLLRRLQSAGIFVREIYYHERLLFCVETNGFHRLDAREIPQDGDLVVPSKFCSIRRDLGKWIVESLECNVTLRDCDRSLVACLVDLDGPTSLAEFAGHLCKAGLDPDASMELAGLVCSLGLLVTRELDEEAPRVLWSAQDLAFHRATRVGYHTRGYGGTYRLADKVGSTSPIREQRVLAVDFGPVDLAAPMAPSRPLIEVMEARRSRREHDDTNPITKDQIGELLFRTVRIRNLFHGDKEDLLDRPEPSGGSTNSIDVYLAVRACKGIDPGMYLYDGQRHGLVEVAPAGPDLTQLISQVPLDPNSTALPQVLLVFACRFGRAMWKYESMAYALVLKDLGVLFQSFYLVGEDMNLAMCAQGGGNSVIFSGLTGCRDLDESSVGEMAIGSIKS